MEVECFQFSRDHFALYLNLSHLQKRLKTIWKQAKIYKFLLSYANFGIFVQQHQKFMHNQFARVVVSVVVVIASSAAPTNQTFLSIVFALYTQQQQQQQEKKQIYLTFR